MSLLNKESIEYYEKILRACGLLAISLAIVSIVLVVVEPNSTSIILSLSMSIGFGGLMVLCIALVEIIKNGWTVGGFKFAFYVCSTLFMASTLVGAILAIFGVGFATALLLFAMGIGGLSLVFAIGDLICFNSHQRKQP